MVPTVTYQSNLPFMVPFLVQININIQWAGSSLVLFVIQSYALLEEPSIGPFQQQQCHGSFLQRNQNQQNPESSSSSNAMVPFYRGTEQQPTKGRPNQPEPTSTKRQQTQRRIGMDSSYPYRSNQPEPWLTTNQPWNLPKVDLDQKGEPLGRTI